MDAQQVDQILGVLAERFGTTAAHLWEVLIRQAYLEAGMAWVIALVLGICAAAVVKPTIDAWDDPLHSSGVVAIGGIFVVVFAAVALVFALAYTTYLLNPEYFALQEVLKAF